MSYFFLMDGARGNKDGHCDSRLMAPWGPPEPPFPGHDIPCSGKYFTLLM